MSIARHHAEWLSMVPVSGPFLSLPVLLEAFPQGLDAHDPEHARSLRLAYEEWDEATSGTIGNRGSKRIDPAIHDAWIRFVLTRTLEYDESLIAEGQAISPTLQVEVLEHGELLRPSMVILDPSTQKSRVLIQTYPRSQDLSSYVADSRWKASPDTRMTELLHATGVRLGIVTNGEQWMLVDAPKGETTGYASWYASLWREEKITLQAFRSLLGMTRLFGVEEGKTLEALLTKSASNQKEVTDQLGYQVRRAVEVLIHSLDRADQDYGRKLLADVTPEQLYESALTVMMRLVFLFCAEERELIPSKPFPVYEQNYSVSAISKQLRSLADQHGEELLERRFDAWPRLLAAFRAVFGGMKHDDLYMPAYGGKLFDPDRFPFLEGRDSDTTWRQAEATPLPVNNRTVLHLLEALQILQVKLPGKGPVEAQRLSFRALDIEQIGHVYEGLLDHTAKRATETYLGLAGTRDQEPEVPLAKLEELVAKGEAPFLKFLKEETSKSEGTLKKRIHIELDAVEEARFRTSCGSDLDLWKRVQRFAGFIRMDSFGYPVVIQAGSVFVTSGTDRRSSGTHYTPRILTEPIVQYTLEPLVYVGPAEGVPRGEWKLKSPRELLDLKICDMACGSGAFLVQACRYMAARLLEAWDALLKGQPETLRMTPEGEPAKGEPGEFLIPEDPDERLLCALRLVAQRCLYGVDINPLAVEMAKLSLWLLTMARDKPFEFLDHNIRCGDSLVGLHSIDQLRHFSLKPDADDAVLFKGPLDSAVDEAIGLRLKLEDMPANTVEDIQRQEKLLAEANEKIARLRCAADLLVSAEFWGENAKDKQERVRHAAVMSGHYVENGPTEEFMRIAAEERRGQKMFHWPLEFPEVIVKRRGFDAFIGNPPFMGGSKISGRIGRHFLDFVVEQYLTEEQTNPDLCAYFFLRALRTCHDKSTVGFVASTAIKEGITREVVLDPLKANGATLFRAISGQIWPGAASVTFAAAWLFLGQWNGLAVLDDKPVASISSYLTPSSEQELSHPFHLVSNEGVAFMGVQTGGMGFVLTPEHASQLIEDNPANAKVLMPYLTGQEINIHPKHQAERWAINFWDWPLEPKTHTGSTSEVAHATAYPDCLKIVEEKVKPDRQRNNRKVYRERWWLYSERRPALYESIKNRSRVLCLSTQATKYLLFAWVAPKTVFSYSVAVLSTESNVVFVALHSAFHETWVRAFTSSNLSLIRYTIANCLGVTGSSSE